MTSRKHKKSAAVGGFVNPASGYKGIKRAGLDHGLSRDASSAVALGITLAPTPVAPIGQVAGKLYQGKKSHDEGAVKAFRATNSKATQKRKAKAYKGPAAVSNLAVRKLGGTGPVGKKKYH